MYPIKAMRKLLHFIEIIHEYSIKFIKQFVLLTEYWQLVQLLAVFFPKSPRLCVCGPAKAAFPIGRLWWRSKCSGIIERRIYEDSMYADLCLSFCIIIDRPFLVASKFLSILYSSAIDAMTFRSGEKKSLWRRAFRSPRSSHRDRETRSWASTSQQLSISRGQHQFILGDNAGALHDFLAGLGCAIVLPPPSEDSEYLTITGPPDQIEAGINRAIELTTTMQMASINLSR
jgi:KH domain-containing protein